MVHLGGTTGQFSTAQSHNFGGGFNSGNSSMSGSQGIFYNLREFYYF
jgi:hypothetical protein